MKTWCRHIYWLPVWKKWMNEYKYFKTGIAFIPRNWTCCPICGTKRPKTNKRPKLSYERQNELLLWWRKNLPKSRRHNAGRAGKLISSGALLGAVKAYEKHSGFTATNVRALPKNPSRYALVEAARRDLRWWEQHSNEVEKSLQRGITAMELELGS